MKKVFHLSTCDTCKRIMNQVNIDDSFDIQDIKTSPISSEQFDLLRSKVSNSEDLLNKRARKYTEMGLKDKLLSEKEIKNLITSEYTFLKRPVFMVGDSVFIGNSKKTIQSLIDHLSE